MLEGGKLAPRGFQGSALGKRKLRNGKKKREGLVFYVQKEQRSGTGNESLTENFGSTRGMSRMFGRRLHRWYSFEVKEAAGRRTLLRRKNGKMLLGG